MDAKQYNLVLMDGELAALVRAVQAARANATGREENTLACIQDAVDKAVAEAARPVGEYRMICRNTGF